MPLSTHLPELSMGPEMRRIDFAGAIHHSLSGSLRGARSPGVSELLVPLERPSTRFAYTGMITR